MPNPISEQARAAALAQLDAAEAAREDILVQHIANGVVINSRTVQIDPEVVIAPGAVILAGTILRGKTVIGAGCRMRCKYCHNPETWKPDEGELKTAKEVFDKAYRYHSYWKNNGGLTVSGGEPLLQIDFLTELFTLAKEKGIHTTLDTSANPFDPDSAEFMEKFEKLMEVTDLVMLDIKEMDPEKHKALTGQTNENILALADWLNEHGKPMWIRHVLVPELTDDEAGLQALREKLDQWSNVERVEILPYHTLGLFKWQNLGIDYPLEGVRTPTQEEVEKAEKILGIRKQP